MKEFSIIIPVFNAASCLNETIQQLMSTMSSLGKEFEIIIVDDGSRDQSWDIIKKIKSEHPHIIGIRLNKNYGQHNAILCGLNHCNSKYIITIDDDLEQNPKDIALLYQTITEKGLDLVYGIPLHVKKSVLRRFLTFIYKFSSKIENKKADQGSSFRIFTNKMKDSAIHHDGSLFFLDEILLWYTNKIAYEKVNFNSSRKKHSGYNYSSLFDLSLRLSSLSSTMPLRIVRMLGFFIFILSFLLAIIFIARKFMFQVPMGYTSIIVTLLFSTGIITFSLGIIGEYLGNLIALSNKKPAYFINEKI